MRIPCLCAVALARLALKLLTMPPSPPIQVSSASLRPPGVFSRLAREQRLASSSIQR
jgi:hypothetical protein